MTTPLSASAQRVQDSLTRLGFTNVVVEHDHTTRSAKDAAEAIGCSVAQIAKSLIFRGKESGRAVLVIASGPNRVNEGRISELVGEAIEKADADFVVQATGFAIGGVPPLGHKQTMITFIDEELLEQGEIWAAGGTPNAVFPVSAEELLKMTGGQAAAIK